MTQTTDLTPFGSTGNLPLRWVPDATVYTKAPGCASLYMGDGTHAPEGVLFRQAASLEDAMGCGGLLLTQPQSGRWWFAVGNDLLDALNWQQVGMIPKVAFANLMSGVDDPSLGFELTRYSPTVKHGWHPGFRLGSGVFRPLRSKALFWQDGYPVYAFGLVTGANFGLGVCDKTNANYCAYMSSTVPFNQPFSKWMDRAKQATIDSANSDVRPYYERTYASAMAAFAHRNRIPSSSVSTYWRAGKLVESFPHPETYKIDVGEEASGKQIVFSGMFSKCLPGLDIRYQGQPAFNSFLAERYPDLQVIAAGMSNGSTGVSFAGKGTAVTLDATAWKNGHFFLQDGAGAWCAEGGSWKGVTPIARPENVPASGYGKTAVTAARSVQSARGTLAGGLQAGKLRDGHVLGRSLVSEIRYHADTDTRTAAEYVGQLRADLATYTMEGTAPITEAALAEYRDQNMGESASKGRSWMDRGTLIPILESFGEAWDKAAEDLARKEN